MMNGQMVTNGRLLVFALLKGTGVTNSSNDGSFASESIYTQRNDHYHAASTNPFMVSTAFGLKRKMILKVVFYRRMSHRRIYSDFSSVLCDTWGGREQM